MREHRQERYEAAFGRSAANIGKNIFAIGLVALRAAWKLLCKRIGSGDLWGVHTLTNCCNWGYTCSCPPGNLSVRQDMPVCAPREAISMPNPRYVSAARGRTNSLGLTQLSARLG